MSRALRESPEFKANTSPFPIKSNRNPVMSKQTTDIAKSTLALQKFPGIVNQDLVDEIKYGTLPALRFPVGLNKDGSYLFGEIDPALLRGKGTMRLVNIKAAKKLAGKDTDEGTVWFNKEVRDVFHKALKFANRLALERGVPVSLGISTRTTKKTGRVVMTTKHGYEHEIVPAHDEKALNKARVQSKHRAKRQARKLANQKRKGLTNVGEAIDIASTPVPPTA